MRLFVAVTPPEPVLDELVALIDRLRGAPAAGNLRWADRSQLHVTLRFLGEVDEAAVAGLVAALDSAPLPAATATLGPAVVRLGRQVLCAPVAGLDALATAVIAATAGVGRPPESRPFAGHVTLARAKGRRGGAVDRSVAGSAVTGGWPVDDVQLVQSHLGSSGARYEVVHSRPLHT